MRNVVNLGDLVDPTKDAGKVALIELGRPGPAREYTYSEMEAMAGGVAQRLARRGFAEGTRIAILALNSAAYVAAYFGIMRAGFVAVPINVRLPLSAIHFILDDAGAALAFVDEDRAGMVPRHLPVVDLREVEAPCAAGAGTTHSPAPDDIAQLLYTSGSTGRPKGVPLSHAGQIWAVATVGWTQEIELDRYLVAAPLFHMNALFNTKLVFYAHASMVLMPAFAARPYIEAIARWRVTALNAVPTMLARAVKERELIAATDLSSVRRVTMGSAPLTRALLDQVGAVFRGAALRNGYGTTEAGPAVFGPHPNGIPAPPLALGYPLPGSEIRLADGPSDDEGVLMMRNPAVMAGYHNLPEQTRAALHDGWYYSGDVMRRDAEGFYHFIGRADDMFVCSGENIYPGEVETMLERHPAIHQACVVPLPDEERGHVPVAFIVRNPGGPLGFAEVKRFALENAPPYHYPRRVAFVDELPWAGTNKIDRRALTQRAATLESTKSWSC